MALAAFYDTETTGLPRADLAIYQREQPHLVQVAALLVDLDTRLVVSTLDVLVRPAGWTIPDEVTAIHGITHKMASEAGVEEREACRLLLQLCAGRLRVGHNERFDATIVATALSRYGALVEQYQWCASPKFCTMAAAKPVMKMPANQRLIDDGRGHEFKDPRLSEAYSYFVGLPMTGAHNAKMDARATMEVFFALRDRGLAP